VNQGGPLKGFQKFPFPLDFKAGETKAFCRCGKTSTAPFCNGSHKGTGDSPIVIEFKEDKKAKICGCLTSGNLPFCDGSHNKLKE
jgi:CDGSH-type Zn-finger protein